MDNFRIVYKILRYLEKAMDYDEPDMDFISAGTLGISRRRWNAIIEMLTENGYIKGIEIKISADGNETVISVNSPKITLKGLEYLHENSMMHKAASAAKGKVNIIK